MGTLASGSARSMSGARGNEDMNALLREAGAYQRFREGGCAPESVFDAYRRGTLPEEDCSKLEAHLLSCNRCVRALAGPGSPFDTLPAMSADRAWGSALCVAAIALGNVDYWTVQKLVPALDAQGFLVREEENRGFLACCEVGTGSVGGDPVDAGRLAGAVRAIEAVLSLEPGFGAAVFVSRGLISNAGRPIGDALEQARSGFADVQRGAVLLSPPVAERVVPLGLPARARPETAPYSTLSRR